MAGRHNRIIRKRRKEPLKTETGEPLPDTHCPECGKPRDVRGFPQGYDHGKKTLCDLCQEDWVRRGCRDADQEDMLPAQRRRLKHKSQWD